MNQELEQFLKQYELATNTHNFSNVAPLIAKEAVYWFSDGSFVGTEAIQQAFVDTWGKIQDEEYHIDNIEWISIEGDLAVCIYRFQWKGLVDGKEQSGEGRGTNIIRKVDGNWKMLHEHLSESI